MFLQAVALMEAADIEDRRNVRMRKDDDKFALRICYNICLNIKNDSLTGRVVHDFLYNAIKN